MTIPIIISKLQDGSPIGAVAPFMETTYSVPSLVDFYPAGIILPILLPDDGFALWFQRNLSSNTAALAGDGFSLNLTSDINIGINDLSIYLSGGITNINSYNSTGGETSSQVVNGATLFNDITPTQAADGYTDYRCIYIFNDKGIDLTNFIVSITSQVAGGAAVTVGIDAKDDIQNVTVNGTPTSGNFVLQYLSRYEYYDVYEYITVNFDPTPAVWLQNFQNAINNVNEFGFSDAVVTMNQTGSYTAFTITFSGTGKYRYYDLVELYANNLL